MNTEKILQLIRPYVVESQMTYADFERVFGFLPLRERDAVRNIIRDELKIFLVDELVTDATTSDEADEKILRRKSEILASNRILIELVQRGDEQAKQDLLVKNSGLVYKSAKYYHEKFPCSLELDDLIREGNLGILKAAEKFDFSKHTQFSTYATCWIVQAITRTIIVTGQTIRLPVNKVEKIRKATLLDGQFYAQGFSPRRRFKLIAELMATTVDRVTELFRLRNVYMNMTSLDVPVGEDRDAEAVEDSASFICLKNSLTKFGAR